jgi:hypothetical protein
LLFLSNNGSSTVNIDNFTDDQSFDVPYSNLERYTFPLEWDDITISTDVLEPTGKRSKRHRRDNANNNNKINSDKTTNSGQFYSNTDGDLISVSKHRPNKQYSHYRKEHYFIPRVNKLSNSRQHNLEYHGSSNNKLDENTGDIDGRLSTLLQTSEVKSGHRHQDSLSASLHSSKSHSLFDGSNIQHQRTQHATQQQVGYFS